MKNTKMLKIWVIIFFIFSFLFCLQNQSNKSAVNASSTSYENIEEGAIYLRSQMVSRLNTFEIIIDGSHLNDSDISNLYNLAIKHTGVPYEGDYIIILMQLGIVAYQFFIDTFYVPIITFKVMKEILNFYQVIFMKIIQWQKYLMEYLLRPQVR